MIYAKARDERVVEIGLPKVGKLKDGRTVSGYNLMDAESLAKEGWLPFEDVQPVLAENQYADFIEYSITADKIVAKYAVLTCKPEVDEDIELAAAISAATTIDDLKRILLDKMKLAKPE